MATELGCGTMRSFRALLYAECVIFARDKAALTFTFLFPLIFVLLFGFLMGGMGGAEGARLGLYMPDGGRGEVLEEVLAGIGSISVTHYGDQFALQDALEEKKIDFGLFWDGEKLMFHYNSTRVQENYAFQQLATGIAAQFNLSHQGLFQILTTEKIHVGRKASTGWFSSVVPGIMAFSILSAGLFAVSGHITAMKERRLLDQMIVTPMRPIMLLSAVICVRLVIVYISTLITLLVAVVVLKLGFTVSWLRYTIFVTSSTVGVMGLGSLIALVVQRPSSASHIANVVSMLMMFLAGIYFPVEIMPSYLRALSKALPLTYMADAMRYVTGVTEMAETRFWGITIAMLVLAAVLLPLLGRYIVKPDRG